MNNSIILPSVPVGLDRRVDGHTAPSRLQKDSGDFLCTIQESMKSGSGNLVSRPEDSPSVSPPLSQEYRSYLESLRRALLGKGKSLREISLSKEDLGLLKKFLNQCGLSQEKVEKFMRELMKDNPDGEIALSEFFLKIAELDLGEKKTSRPLTLDPSAIPYIESALRACGLMPKAVEDALNSARVEGGGLDLSKLLGEINKINGEGLSPQNQSKLDQVVKAIEQAIKRNEFTQDPTAGNRDKSNHDNVSTVTKLIQGKELPADVRATIEQIAEKAVIREDKNERKSSVPSLSKSGLNTLSAREGRSKGGKVNEKESSPLQAKEKEASTPQLRSVSDFAGVKGSERANTEERNGVKSETNISDIRQDVSGSQFSDKIGADPLAPAREKGSAERTFLPAHLLNQVKRQISRSLLRGEKVIKLQLKPPQLGLLKIDLDIKDNMLRLGMMTENSSVKEILLSHVNELREALAEQGVKLERVDIQINYNFEQSLAHSKDEPGEGQSKGMESGQVPGDTEMETGILGSHILAPGDRLLDVMA